MLPVTITNIRTGDSYTAYSPEDCKDKTDLFGFAQCQAIEWGRFENGTAIGMGSMVFEPVFDPIIDIEEA